ncbi:KAP family P-loop NTPase fold protein [Sulfurimonas hongkongensis]|nr:P-loop NTPase fold protein [Sulfurimonas hongkongensis]
MQHLDIPINHYDSDKLNFKPFAKKVATSILNYNQNETLIFSIEGRWGSGKTSLINLIENEIKGNVEVLHFNPWLLTDISQVIKLFFDELIKILSYGSFKVKLNEDIKKDLKNLANILLPESMTIKVPFINIGYKPKDVLLSSSEDSLEKIKLKINKYLKNLDKKIVIVIDDIDRLTDNETEFIFRLTKGIADFDNLIYILLYDKTIVSKSLQTFKQEDGEKYLEKIVQYSLSVPKPHKLTLHNLLFEKLDLIIRKLEDDGNQIFFDKDKWYYIVNKVFTKYILTIRDINNIINIISFEYPIVTEDVNLSDFFLISLLRVKNNSLYESIQNTPEKFFIDTETMILDEHKNQVIESLKKIIKDNQEYKEILNLLFPIIGTDELGYEQKPINKDHKNKYLADPYYFENYFSFSMSDDKLTHREFKEIEKYFLDSDFDKFKQEILNLDKNRKSSLFLEMFEQTSLDSLNNQNKLNNGFYNAVKISYQLEEGKFDKNMGWTYISPSIRYIWLSYEILRKIDNIDAFLLKFFTFIGEQVVPLIIKVDIYERIIKEISEQSHEKLNIKDETKEQIFKHLKSRLEKLSLDDFLNDDKIETYIFSRYDKFDLTLDKISNELNNYIFKTNDNFFTILNKFKYWQMSSDGNRWLIAKDSLNKLISLEDVEKYISDLKQKDLSDNQKELLEIWDRKTRW